MSGANLIFEIDGQNLDIESAEILNEATGQKEKLINSRVSFLQSERKTETVEYIQENFGNEK
jgi:hypothetical protein